MLEKQKYKQKYVAEIEIFIKKITCWRNRNIFKK